MDGGTAGFLTNCCVESTMRTAYEKGFNVITLTDACATTSPEGQAVTGGSYGMFSTPSTPSLGRRRQRGAARASGKLARRAPRVPGLTCLRRVRTVTVDEYSKMI